MTEAEWLACADPHPMLDFLGDRASVRKLRLLACACSRRLWAHLIDKARHSVEVAELFADGQVRRQALRAAQGPCYSGVRADNSASFAAGPSQAFRRQARFALRHAGWSAGWPDWVERIDPENEAREMTAQAVLVRDLFGNPFRPTVVERGWMKWGGRVVPKLAQRSYEERSLPAGTLDSACLAVLADALQDAGCADDAILSHLRSPGPHVRGCWPVDILLRKK